MYIEPESGTQGSAAFIGVDYEEFKPETFSGYDVEVRDGQHEFMAKEHFDDLSAAEEWAEERASRVYYLSSFDNYAADKARRSGSKRKK